MTAPPTFVEVRRREPETGMRFVGENINVRPRVDVAAQGAPDPIRQSDFYATGRAPGEEFANVPIALYLNRASIQAVMSDTFSKGKARAQFLHLMRNGLGGQAPFGERPNIDRPASAPYGDQASVPGAAGPIARVGSQMVTANGLTYRYGR